MQSVRRRRARSPTTAFPATDAGSNLRLAVNRYRAYAVGFAAIYTLCFCFALPAFIDEAYTYNLVTDPSLRHMLSALAHGADGAFPAYALFAFIWAKVFGASELSLRLTGGLFVILFVWHCGGRLLRRFSPVAVGLALLLVLAAQNFISYTIQARFYGMMIFLFSLGFWGTWDMVEREGPTLWRAVGHGIACGLLCLSHPLGGSLRRHPGAVVCGLCGAAQDFLLGQRRQFLGGAVVPAGVAAGVPASARHQCGVPGWGDGSGLGQVLGICLPGQLGVVRRDCRRGSFDAGAAVRFVRYAERRWRRCARFPLTPALSLRERESRSPVPQRT
jgi:hypothetical protein